MSTHSKNQQGFTLVELLIVVIILGILAAVVIPQFNSAANESREAAVASNLATVRQAIEMYKVQHNDTLPGTVTGVTFQNALISQTTAAGAVSTTGPYGPYLRNSFPKSPVDGSDTVTVTATGTIAAAGATSVGWAYDSSTGEFRCNSNKELPSDAALDYFDL